MSVEGSVLAVLAACIVGCPPACLLLPCMHAWPFHPPPLVLLSVCAVSDINVDAPEGMSYAEWEASNVRRCTGLR